MSESRLRIPRVAMATLVLGSSCGGDDGGSGGGDGVSESRVLRVARAVCARNDRCESYDEEEEEECVQAWVGYLNETIAASRACGEAALDYYSCYASLTCSEVEAESPPKCAALERKIESACPDLDDDEEG